MTFEEADDRGWTWGPRFAEVLPAGTRPEPEVLRRSPCIPGSRGLWQELSSMFEQIFENFRKATETTLQAQQDLFRQWMSQWPSIPIESPPKATDTTLQAQQDLFRQWMSQWPSIPIESPPKAPDTTLQAQQDLFRQWMSQWPSIPIESPPTDSKGKVSDQVKSFQEQWSDGVMALMTRHSEALDAQYRAGIHTIEDALRTTEAKSPEEFCKLTEELWRKSFEVLKQTIENQVRDFQVAVEKWSELMTQKSSKA